MAIKAEEMITITRKEYEQLKKDSEWLICLEASGVDNWSGFDFAAERYHDLQKEKTKKDAKEICQ